ncbi:MAG: YeeE/YedE family protein [Fimbriimonadales bacterium]|nr:YeeE/YedE family protein [Fimbriimonadales bacterium]
MITLNRSQTSQEASREVQAIAACPRLPNWLLWGGMIGLVQIFAIATVQPLGVSTAYPQLVGYLVDKIVPGFAESQPYLQKIGAKIGWEVMLIIGIALGALLSRLLQGRAATTADACEVPQPFRSSVARGLAAFVGGFLILFGARLAGGCTSGHMLSGIAQLAVSGFLFGAAAFATGVLIASLLLRRTNSQA